MSEALGIITTTAELNVFIGEDGCHRADKGHKGKEKELGCHHCGCVCVLDWKIF